MKWIEAGRITSSDPSRRRLRTDALVTIFLAIGLLLATPAVAEPAVTEPEYTYARKLRRGFANLSLGVLAVPGQMVEQVHERGIVAGVPVGVVMGLGYFVASEFVGCWEILTSRFEGEEGFRPIIDPEFPWDYFE